ncbi:MAG: hypothetical protein EOO38_10995, partial [Cytophagaceae bacterium]
MPFRKSNQDERYVLIGIAVLLTALFAGPGAVNPDSLDTIDLVLKGNARQEKGRNAAAYSFHATAFPCRFRIDRPGGEATGWRLEKQLQAGDTLTIRYAPAGVLNKKDATAWVYA